MTDEERRELVAILRNADFSTWASEKAADEIERLVKECKKWEDAAQGWMERAIYVGGRITEAERERDVMRQERDNLMNSKWAIEDKEWQTRFK